MTYRCALTCIKSNTLISTLYYLSFMQKISSIFTYDYQNRESSTDNEIDYQK